MLLISIALIRSTLGREEDEYGFFPSDGGSLSPLLPRSSIIPQQPSPSSSSDNLIFQQRSRQQLPLLFIRRWNFYSSRRSSLSIHVEVQLPLRTRWRILYSSLSQQTSTSLSQSHRGGQRQRRRAAREEETGWSSSFSRPHRVPRWTSSSVDDAKSSQLVGFELLGTRCRRRRREVQEGRKVQRIRLETHRVVLVQVVPAKQQQSRRAPTHRSSFIVQLPLRSIPQGKSQQHQQRRSREAEAVDGVETDSWSSKVEEFIVHHGRKIISQRSFHRQQVRTSSSSQQQGSHHPSHSSKDEK